MLVSGADRGKTGGETGGRQGSEEKREEMQNTARGRNSVRSAKPEDLQAEEKAPEEKHRLDVPAKRATPSLLVHPYG